MRGILAIVAVLVLSTCSDDDDCTLEECQDCRIDGCPAGFTCTEVVRDIFRCLGPPPLMDARLPDAPPSDARLPDAPP
jgi:hypothetical protein